MKLTSRVDVDRHTTTVAVSGDLTGGAVVLRRELLAIAELAGPAVELDLAAAHGVDRALVGTLQAVAHQLLLLGGALTVTGRPPGHDGLVLDELACSPATGGLRAQMPSVRSRTSA